jgi:hypothetical protein
MGAEGGFLKGSWGTFTDIQKALYKLFVAPMQGNLKLLNMLQEVK